VSVTIRCVAPSIASAAPVPRTLPLSLKVGSLKFLCQQQFTLVASRQRLHFRDPAVGGALPEELSDDTRPLSYYGIRDGHEILMNEADAVDEEKVREEDERREKMQQEQIAAAEAKRHAKLDEVEREKKAASARQ
jgi:hypothetical protein